MSRLRCPFFEQEPDWSAVDPHPLVEAVNGGAARQFTSFRCAWTARELHVLFHAEDDDVWATFTERDAPLYDEEVVEVFLDPVGDLQSYFEIEVNPLNAVLDLVLRKNASGYRKDFRWQCEGLRTSVRKEPHFWTAHLAIPFASLGPDLPKPANPWRANFYRIDRPKNAPLELSAWSPVGRENFHTPERFGVIEFVR